MSIRIEWADLNPDLTTLAPPGEYVDDHGTENERPALAVGDGIVIEGTHEQWLRFADNLRRAAWAKLPKCEHCGRALTGSGPHRVHLEGGHRGKNRCNPVDTLKPYGLEAHEQGTPCVTCA